MSCLCYLRVRRHFCVLRSVTWNLSSPGRWAGPSCRLSSCPSCCCQSHCSTFTLSVCASENEFLVHPWRIMQCHNNHTLRTRPPLPKGNEWMIGLLCVIRPKHRWINHKDIYLNQDFKPAHTKGTQFVGPKLCLSIIKIAFLPLIAQFGWATNP